MSNTQFEPSSEKGRVQGGHAMADKSDDLKTPAEKGSTNPQVNRAEESKSSPSRPQTNCDATSEKSPAKPRTKRNAVAKRAGSSNGIAPEDRPFIRAENEDDDGYDPYSDRQPHAEPLFERDPWD